MSTVREELQGYYFEDLEVGLTAVFSRTVSDADIATYAAVSGDTNPLHLDAEFAATTRFGGRVAHGMLSAGFISAVIGTRLPGPGCIYLGQRLKFRRPVRSGDTVVARVTVEDLKPARQGAVSTTVGMVGDSAVIDGDASAVVPGRAK